jgi:AraC family transcriptional regulator, positive regulator of tynA and feaB
LIQRGRAFDWERTGMALITTAGQRPQDSFAYFEEIVRRDLMPTRMEPARGEPFMGEVRTSAIGGLIAARMSASGGRGARTDTEIADSPAAVYVINLQLAGNPRVQFASGEPASMTVGDLWLLDAHRPYDLQCDGPSQCLATIVPKEWVDRRMARPGLVHGSIMRRDDGFARFLSGYLINGYEAAATLAPASTALVAEHLVELVAEGFGDMRPAPTPSQAWREALFVRACRAIGLKCGDPDLAPEQIARGLGVSVRLLQRVFAERGQTIMRRVFDERVERAARLLASRQSCHRSITEIAYACGFNDSAHFTRAFAARMGMTPTSWRRDAAQSAEQA